MNYNSDHTQEINNIIEKINLFCCENDINIPDSLSGARNMLSSMGMNIGIIGAFNSGKSTLLNCLIGKDLLPRGFLPTTSAITTIEYGENEELLYESSDGQIQTSSFKIGNLKSLIAVKKQEEEISRVWIKYPTNYGGNITFIDTPGIDDIDEWRSIRTSSILSQVDVAILLFVHPITSTVLDYLKKNVVQGDIRKIFFCMTHIDKGGIRENLVKVNSENENEIEKHLGFKPNIHSIDLLGCLNTIILNGQKSPEFIQFENEFRHFIESSEARKVLFGRAITKIQYAASEIGDKLKAKLEISGKNKGEVEEIISKNTRKIEDLRLKELELLEEMDDRLSKLYDNIELTLTELNVSLQNDIDLELNGYLGEVKPFIESRLPILIKKEILNWENTRKPFIIKFIKSVQDHLSAELIIISNGKKPNNSTIPKELNSGQTIIPGNVSSSVIQSTAIEYQPKSDNQIIWNIGAIAAALVTGQFYIAFAPMIFDRLFGLSKKRTLKEKDAARPIIKDYVQNAIMNFKDKILYEIDKYRKNIKNYINEEIEVQINTTKSIIRDCNSKIKEIDIDNEQKKIYLSQKIKELETIQIMANNMFNMITDNNQDKK